MNFEDIVGSWKVRLTTLAVAVLWILFLLNDDSFGMEGLSTFLRIGGAVLCFAGLVFSFQSLYRRWMAFTTILHGILTQVLFGAVYLLLVPWIVLFVRMNDPLRMSRRAEDSDTYWITRRSRDRSPRSYQRMG